LKGLTKKKKDLNFSPAWKSVSGIKQNDPYSDSYVKNEELVLHVLGYEPVWKPRVWTANYEKW
jgi:hypothetical protein